MRDSDVDYSEIILAKNLKYVYPDGTVGVKNINLIVRKMDKIALIGANGSGKSTLLLLFAGLLKPTEGDLKIFDMEINRKNSYFFRKNIGIVFQNPDDFLFNPTVMDELLYTPRNFGISLSQAKKMAEEYAKIFGIEKILKKQPFRLSGGEKKRVALACVLMLKPKLLLLDEPTSNVDGKTRRKILEILKNYSGTMIIATHELKYLEEIVDGVAILSMDKEILAYGGKELLKNEKLLDDAGVL